MKKRILSVCMVLIMMFTMLPMTALAGPGIIETYDELVREMAEDIGDRDYDAYTIYPAEDFGWPEHATLTIPSDRHVFVREVPLEIPSGITIVVEDDALFGGEELLVNGTIVLENGSFFSGNQLLVNGTVNFPYQDISLSFQKVTVGPTANFGSSNSSIGRLPHVSIPVGSTWELQEGATLNANVFLQGTLTGEGTVTGGVSSYGAYSSQAVDGILSGNLTLTGGLRVGYEHSDMIYDDKLTIPSGSHITLKNANLQLAKATINLGGMLEFVNDDGQMGYGNARIAQGGKILMDGGQLIVNYPCSFYQSAVSYDMDLTEETRDQFPRLIEGNGTIICNTNTVEEALSHTLLSHRVTDILEYAKDPDKLTRINCFIDFKTVTVQAYAPKTYTVNFDPMGGQVSTVQAATDANGQLSSLPVPTRDGYVFDGWYTHPTDGEPITSAHQFTVDTTIYAQWTLAPTFTVTFEPNGGNVSPTQMTTDTDGTLTTLPTPTRDGYAFNGWYIQPTGGETVTSAYQFSIDTTIYAQWSVIQGSITPDYDYGGGSYNPPVSSGSSTTTQKNPDGSTTTTKTDKDGTVTETTKHTDGSTSTVETAKDGTVTTTEKDAKGNKTETVEKTDGTKEFTAKQKDGSEATASVDRNGAVKAEVELTQKALNNAATNNEAVTLPIPAISVDKFSAASTITVDLPDNTGKTSVVVPMEEMTPGSVVVMVLPDGTEKVVIATKTVEEGLAVELDGDCTFKVVDNSKDFADVKPGDWFSDATDFVSSRELFAGTSKTEFSPNAEMTMEMLFAVAHNFMGKPERTGTNDIAGAKPEDWFHTASNWAAEAGLTEGLKMDMLGRNLPISREDTAILLYNLANVEDYIPSMEALSKLNEFSDIADLDPEKVNALAWVVENGIMNGMGDGTFGFKGNNTRAQTGAIMMNFNNNL